MCTMIFKMLELLRVILLFFFYLYHLDHYTAQSISLVIETSLFFLFINVTAYLGRATMAADFRTFQPLRKVYVSLARSSCRVDRVDEVPTRI